MNKVSSAMSKRIEESKSDDEMGTDVNSTRKLNDSTNNLLFRGKAGKESGLLGLSMSIKSP